LSGHIRRSTTLVAPEQEANAADQHQDERESGER
jgi:hypothetical protein